MRNVAASIVLSLLLCIFVFLFACFLTACFWRHKDAYNCLPCIYAWVIRSNYGKPKTSLGKPLAALRIPIPCHPRAVSYIPSFSHFKFCDLFPFPYYSHKGMNGNSLIPPISIQKLHCGLAQKNKNKLYMP